MIQTVVRLKGGPGSGHRGHRGRPGKRGGSLPGSGGVSIKTSADKNYKESERLGIQCDAVEKQCWKNSVMALALVEGGVYVEGYMAFDLDSGNKFPIAHGWLEDEDGKVIDVTLPKVTGTYYGAKKYTLKDIFELMGGEEVILPFITYKDKNFQEARRLAHKDAFGIDLNEMLKGGRGSGHWGHAGRPGKVGGSLPGGGGGGGMLGVGSPEYAGDMVYADDLQNGQILDEHILHGERTRAEWKAFVTQDLAERADMPPELVEAYIRSWAASSNNEHKTSLSLQEAATEEFDGIELSPWQRDKVNFTKGYFSDFSDHREEERRLVRAMYQSTQEHLHELGFRPGDRIALYRGVGENGFYQATGTYADPSETMLDYKGNALESWTTSFDTAVNFAYGEEGDWGNYPEGATGGAVLRMAVPIENIVSIPMTGIGAVHETEVVIFGRYKRAMFTAELDKYIEPGDRAYGTEEGDYDDFGPFSWEEEEYEEAY